MNKLHVPQAKLFYAVAEAYQKKLIDETEKRLLKQKIITDNVEIFEVLDSHQSEADLIEHIILLVKGEQPRLLSQDVESEHLNADDERPPVAPTTEQEEASSPWGEFLRGKKYSMKGQQHRNEVEEIKSLIKPEKAE